MSRTTAAVAPVFQLYFHNLVMHSVIMADSDLGIDLRQMSQCPETKKQIQKVTHTKLVLIENIDRDVLDGKEQAC